MLAHTFSEALAKYKQAINDDIAAYGAYIHKVTGQQYGPYAELEIDTFLDMLSRGGKRFRGVLVMVGYEMCGGTDRAMILQAARAIEMFHAYLLMCDDIQDHSPLRRGKPSAHEQLAAYHRQHNLKGDPQVAGVNLALNAALAGAHAAQVIMANMDADPQLKLNAISITNRTLGITEHGQTYDILNAMVTNPSEADIQHTLEWKSAQYSVVNPLHVGMVLAGAGCEATDAITPFALHAGKSFQIIDDLGIYGSEAQLGKSPMDDIREGKGTLLTFFALEHATKTEAQFLRRCLGNSDLLTQEFAQCLEIITSCGAKKYAEEQAEKELHLALEGLEAGKALWSAQGHEFLKGMALYLSSRSK
jgi:geranylgeranyl diphosphate synthase type I